VPPTPAGHPPPALAPHQLQSAPVSGPAGPAPAPTRSSARAGILIAAGITITLIVLAGALIALFSTLSNLGQAADDDTPTVVASSPPCDGCLSFEDALSLRLSGGVPTLGLSFDEELGYAKPSTAGVYADSSAQNYEDGGGSPAGCAFTIDYSPVAPENPDATNRADRVADLGTFSNDTDSMSQVVRVFATPQDAAAYPDALRAGIAACPQYSVSFSEGGGFWSTDVVPTEFATSSPGVTAVGWTEEYDGYAVTVVDLQYENLVVRTIYNRAIDSAYTNAEVAAFVTEYSGLLAGLG
jgi:hypothetical protein